MFDGGTHSHASALEQATATARALIEGAERLRNRSMNEVPLLAWLPFLKLATEDSDVNSCDPVICEVLLFGSVAKKAEDVGDVDLMVLDTGFYSMLVLNQDRRDDGTLPDSKEGALQDNLRLLLGGYMEYEEDLIEGLSLIPTDLHVLPCRVVTDEAFREEIAQQHLDPYFFENAFSCMMRYERTCSAFVPTTLIELQSQLRIRESA